jgi:hypothetical protein
VRVSIIADISVLCCPLCLLSHCSLPIDDAEFIRTHTRFLIKLSNHRNPDQALPRSDTVSPLRTHAQRVCQRMCDPLFLDARLTLLSILLSVSRLSPAQCFFNFELPAYSTPEILRAKMLYAIESDSSMNADSPNESDHDAARANNRRRVEEESDF